MTKFPIKAFIINTVLILIFFLKFAFKKEHGDLSTVAMYLFFYSLPLSFISFIVHLIFYLLNKCKKKYHKNTKYVLPSITGLLISLKFGFLYDLWIVVVLSTAILIISEIFSDIE